MISTAVLLLATLAFGDSAVEPSSGAPLPIDLEDRIVALESWPEQLRLERPFESLQLLVSGRLADGSRIDVTRHVELVNAPSLVGLDDRGLMRAAGGSEGLEVLHFRLGDHTLDVPVTVESLEQPEPSLFVRDVMPILNKAGCTAGTCHGAADGQNGFRLSLRGYDPTSDHRSLTDDLAGRRFNPVAPERSLFLQKLTGAVPHEGGTRMEQESPDYSVLLDWVTRGAQLESSPARVVSLELHPSDPSMPQPGLSQQFSAWATYTDGSRRDVTALSILEVANTEVAAADERGLISGLRRGESAILARFEGAYAATRLVVMEESGAPFEWNDEPAHNYVDELVHEKLRRVHVNPSELCTDAEFLRRVRLDLTGKIPTPREVRIFRIDSRDARVKRDELIDRLIGSPEFVDHWSNRWADLLQVNSKFLGAEGARRTRDWIRASVASNQPYDEFVAAILRGTGSTYEQPESAYYKVLREPDLVMENTTQLFLGVRFSCNKCHDHPFERWTRDEHWQLAAFFGRVGRENAPGSRMMPRSAANALDGTPPAFEELISDLEQGEVTDPETGLEIAPAFPYELEDLGLEEETSRRGQLAAWLTAPSNPYFARSYVNRLWSYLLGVGLIEPIDDLRAGNPPSNPALLEHLTSEFLESDFDVRELLRTICQSRAYQRSIGTNDSNASDELNYAHALARRLPAEVLYDALHQATGSSPQLPGLRPGTTAAELVDTSFKTPDGFLDLFGRPPRESSCECERTNGMSLGQALSLINGPTVADAVRDPNNDIARLVMYERDPARILDEIYVAFLGRSPSATELASLLPTFDTSDIANLAALPPEELQQAIDQQAAWESGLSITEWSVATPTRASSKEGAVFEIAEDGSILVTGEAAERDSYSIIVQATAGPIRGLRIEALPHDSLPVKGPGRSQSGNFVLNELRVNAVPLGAPELSRPLSLQNATADYSQSGWAVPGAVDGNPTSGWAIASEYGKVHQAVFELAEDIGGESGTVLFLELDQNYGSAHTFGNLRISTTSSARPVRFNNLSPAVARALLVPREERSEADLALIYAEFARHHPKIAERVRLGAAQDLAWALAGSPAFLFNR